MHCEIEYKQSLAEVPMADAERSNHGGSFRVRKIVGRADQIHKFFRKQTEVVAIKILARETKQG